MARYLKLERSFATALAELLTEVHQHVAFDRILADRVSNAADLLESLLYHQKEN